MDKKMSLIVVAIAVLLIVVGAALIITNPLGGEAAADTSDIPLKSHDFKLFEIKTPEASNFTVKNEADGMKYYQNHGKYNGNFSGIIISKGLTDSLIGDNAIPISNSTDEQLYSFVLKNETNYKYVSNQGDVDIILIGTDLNLLKEVSDSIKIKDTSNL